MSDRELVYRVTIVGQAQFASTLKSLTDITKKAAQEQIAIDDAVAKKRRAVQDGSAKHHASLLKTQIALEKARARESVRESERAEREAIKNKTRAERDKTTALSREMKARERLAAQAQRETIRQQQAELRAFERTEREKTRIAQREAMETQRFVMRSQAATAREIMRQRQQAANQMAREDRDRMFDRKRFYRGVGQGFVEGGAGAARALYGVASRGVRSIAQASGFDRSWDIADIAQEQMSVDATLRSASIEARLAGKSGSFDEKGAGKKIRFAALKYGLKQSDLAGAIDAYSEKGSAATAVTNIDRIASQATALGTSASVIAKLRAQMGLSSAVSGKELTEDEKDQLVAKMHFIGKTGVFRAEDVAQESESLFSQFAKGGGDFKQGFERYLSFANQARVATGSGAMARTSINAVQDAIAKKEGKLNALGVKTRDADGSNRDFIEVVMDAIVKTDGKGKAFTQIFDPSRSGKAISTMMSAYNDASGYGKNKGAGRAAMEKLLSGDASLKHATVAEMNKDAASRLDTPAVKIAQATETIRQSLAGELAPVLEAFAKKAPAIAASIAKALDFVVKHPMLTLGGIVGAGAMQGAAKPMAGALARFAGDVVGGIGSRFGGMGGALTVAAGGALKSAGAQPVYVTGAAPGVFPVGGGGGLSLPGGGGGGGAGAGGVIGRAVMSTAGMGVALAAMVGIMATSSDQHGEGTADKAVEAAKKQRVYNELRKRGMSPDQINKHLAGANGNLLPEEQIARDALASPYANDNEAAHIAKVLNPDALASPYASPDDYDFDKGGTSTFRFDKNPTAKGAFRMPVTKGEKGYGVLKPVATTWDDPEARSAEGKSGATLATDSANKSLDSFGKAVDDVTAKLRSFEANSSALKQAFGRM